MFFKKTLPTRGNSRISTTDLASIGIYWLAGDPLAIQLAVARLMTGLRLEKHDKPSIVQSL